ncbi:LOB domain-containing protein 30-like [Salvia miltiorrhiza]|uniref:LOB domain-containing protein 30-like n=1 Tax=Salvia miltiorrhiza TaxID=226208 RepID=UPI0025ACA8D6|nr:LOB domain-containing protein 30-like [Salvia miltiorrhiza]
MSSSSNFACSSMSPAGGGGSSSSGGGGGAGGGGPCGACKFLRRKCVAGCIFAPYFDSEQGAAHFAAVHKVFGASNVSKLLLHIPVQKRPDAVVTICYEAQARLRDPVYGCVAHIFALQQQVVNLQAELSYLQAHLATLELPTPPPAPPQPPSLLTPPPLSIADLPTFSAIPSTHDLSSLFDPTAWIPHHQRHDIDTASHFPTAAHRGGGDLQELAREFLSRRATPAEPCRNQASALPPHSSA